MRIKLPILMLCLTGTIVFAREFISSKVYISTTSVTEQHLLNIVRETTATTNKPFSNAVIIYVDSANGNDDYNGETWATAYKTLSHALKISNENTSVDSILIAHGTYYPTGTQIVGTPSTEQRDSTFLIGRGGIKMYGGYPSGGGERNTDLYTTTLSGDIGADTDSTFNSYHVMVITGIQDGADSVIINGLTISYGNANTGGSKLYHSNIVYKTHGGGIYITDNDSQWTELSIQYCTITNNNAQNNGGGIYSNSSNGLITHSYITNNKAAKGGGMFKESCSINITHSSFTYNEANLSGGAIGSQHPHWASSWASVINTTISGNIAQYGGGISDATSFLSIVGCVISGNKASVKGGGIIIENDNGNNKIVNSTIAGNVAPDGGGLHLHDATPFIYSTIIWGNAADNNPSIRGVPAVVNSSIIEHGDYSAGTGNSNQNPAFLHPQSASLAPTHLGNYRLQYCSPAIDAGNNNAIEQYEFETDSDEKLRIQFTRIDIGAYEVDTKTPGIGNLPTKEGYSITEQDNAATTQYLTLCNEIVASITGDNSPSSLQGNTYVTVWVKNTTTNYVARQYEITPQNNPATASGVVTLYFTQEDFDNFNLVAENTIKLPLNKDDTENYKANILIEKISGSSSDNSCNPNTYTGPSETIIPQNVVWNETDNRWEITFAVTGFSGFFVKTTSDALPLKLISFTAKVVDDAIIGNNNCTALINWETIQEENVSHFELQYRSSDAPFTTIRSINAKNTHGNHHYQVLLPITSTTTFYRLKMIDIDGKTTYSNEVMLTTSCNTESLRVYPNPANNVLYISTHLTNEKFSIYDNTGRMMMQGKIINNTEEINISQLPTGSYVLKVNNSVIRFIKVH